MFKSVSLNASKSRQKQLNEFQAEIGYRFRDLSLLCEAFTHRSFINESRLKLPDNERLEYLGDSVLALVVNEYLYKHFPKFHEGELAKIKAKVVSEEILDKIAREIGLGKYLELGKGEETTGGRTRVSILANTVEAVIGAMYLDTGLKFARNFILLHIKKYIVQVETSPTAGDPKSAIQEIVQKKYKQKPDYKLISESGPDHQKVFEVVLVICGKEIIKGVGSSKRRAETEAAVSALDAIAKKTLEI